MPPAASEIDPPASARRVSKRQAAFCDDGQAARQRVEAAQLLREIPVSPVRPQPIEVNSADAKAVATPSMAQAPRPRSPTANERRRSEEALNCHRQGMSSERRGPAARAERHGGGGGRKAAQSGRGSAGRLPVQLVFVQSITAVLDEVFDVDLLEAGEGFVLQRRVEAALRLVFLQQGDTLVMQPGVVFLATRDRLLLLQGERIKALALGFGAALLLAQPGKPLLGIGEFGAEGLLFGLGCRQFLFQACRLAGGGAACRRVS